LDFASFHSISASFVRTKIAHAEAIFLRDGLFLCYGRVPRSERWESMGMGGTVDFVGNSMVLRRRCRVKPVEKENTESKPLT